MFFFSAQPDDQAVVAALRESPEVKVVLDRRAAETRDERKRLAQRIADGEKQAGENFKKLQQESATALAAYRKLEEAAANAARAYHAVEAKRSAESWRWTVELNGIEAKLIETADPAITAFVVEMRDELDVTAKAQMPGPTMLVERNPNTGKEIIRQRVGELVSPSDRMRAIRAAIDAALALRLESDQSDVCAKLAALRASLPIIGWK